MTGQLKKAFSDKVDAGALYFAIVIAFFIAILSASIIMLAAHYRNSYLKEIRFQRLMNNIESGITISLLRADATEPESEELDLFGDQSDSVKISKNSWGLFELVQLESSISLDTLKRVFFAGHQSDTDGEVLCLSDEDRPISVSGATRIVGNVRLPKSGIRKAYAEGKPFSGNEAVSGMISDSGRSLDELNVDCLNSISSKFNYRIIGLQELPRGPLKNAFSSSAKLYKLSGRGFIGYKLQGNIEIHSDRVVRISAESVLENIVVYAPSIIVEEGFTGACQLFARDSIIVGNGTVFNYPSVLGLIKSDTSSFQTKISLGKNVLFNGIIFSWEKKRSSPENIIEIDADSQIEGELYSKGMIKLSKDTHLFGRVSCHRFIMKTTSTLYENFLIDVEFNRKKLNRHYLSSGITAMKNPKKILKWLD